MKRGQGSWINGETPSRLKAKEVSSHHNMRSDYGLMTAKSVEIITAEETFWVFMIKMCMF